MHRTRHFVFAASIALAGVVAAACEPIENAPPGGGTVVTNSFRIGPFDLAAMGQPGWENQGTRTNVPRPSGAFGIKTMSFDIVDENGDPVPRHMVHLHHVLLMNPARQDAYCTRAERFAGSGSERTPLSLPDPYVYLNGQNESWNALWHIMNMSEEPMTVSIEYTIGYQPAATAQNSRPVKPFFLDVTGCGNSQYNVPGGGGPGSIHTNTRSFTAPWDGYLTFAGGHLHEGGIDIALRDDAAGTQCKMSAHYEAPMGDHNPPHEITTCPIHVRVEGGNSYSVISRYDNSMPRAGVMGIVLAYAWQGTQ